MSKVLDKHLFAIYLDNLSPVICGVKAGDEFELKDRDLHQRLTCVLRLKEDESAILFDKKLNVEVILGTQTFKNKNTVFGIIEKIEENKSLKPQIIFCPALLKKRSFEEVLYLAAQMGANVIHPILTQKVQKNWWQKKEIQRCEKIMIAACEQSKNFVLPQLNEPLELQDFLKEPGILGKNKKIVFETTGQPLFDLLAQLHEKKIDQIMLMVGPEGGFIEPELEILKENDFEFYSLTPTILTAVQATAVGLGSVRSVAR